MMVVVEKTIRIEKSVTIETANKPAIIRRISTGYHIYYGSGV